MTQARLCFSGCEGIDRERYQAGPGSLRWGRCEKQTRYTQGLIRHALRREHSTVTLGHPHPHIPQGPKPGMEGRLVSFITLISSFLRL